MAIYTSSNSTPTFDWERIHEIRDEMHPDSVPRKRKFPHTPKVTSVPTVKVKPVSGTRKPKESKTGTKFPYYSKNKFHELCKKN